MALTLYIPLKSYLAQWLIHKHGGQSPIKIGKCSPEAIIIERHLRPPLELCSLATARTQKPGVCSADVARLRRGRH